MYNWEKFLTKNTIKIYCICLNSRDDKYNIVCDEFKKLDLVKHVNFHRPEKNNNPGLGCFLSHKYCMNNASSENKHALVFEDDIVFTEDWLFKINKISDFLDTIDNWDTIRFGCFLSSLHKDINNTPYIHLSKSYMTHAICYNKKFIRHILFNEKVDESVQIDDYLHQNLDIREYALINPICYQRIINNVSDNEWMSKYVQNVFQNKYIYENLQYFNNKYVNLIKCLPTSVQESINIWNIIYKIF
jgi:GR25 family glycosyltransferase involved in LPS biosynthesis